MTTSTSTIGYIESGGFWTHEALLVVREELYGEMRLVVVEGNRRLAALKYLHAACDGRATSSRWEDIAKIAEPPTDLFTKVPYLVVDTRQDIQAFLGFRHVTGIKEWEPAEKAEFIAKLVDDGLSYQEVMRKIGSKTPAVRQNYISYRLLLQMENSVEDFVPELAENRFSVMYLSLRTKGVQNYLYIDIMADPQGAKEPVPHEHLDALSNFALWLFGDAKRPPLFTDSRQVDQFGAILDSPEAVEYLGQTSRPNFDLAFQKAGGDEPELIRLIKEASENISLSLSSVHRHKEKDAIQGAVRRLAIDAKQLLDIFPKIRDEVNKD